jgi:hypothetical protein
MSRFMIYITLFSAFLLHGCGSVPPSRPANSELPALEGEWTISMVQSGGIMGLSRSIEISFDATYTVTDRHGEITITGRLSAEQLEVLREIVLNTEYQSTVDPGQSGCADCFIYNVQVQAEGRKFVVELDDISMPGSGMERLIMHLQLLLESALNSVQSIIS